MTENYDGLYGEDLEAAAKRAVDNALFEAEVLERERRLIKVGDPKHPINVEDIKKALQCIPDVCEVEILLPYLEYESIRIHHKMPAHERVYRLFDRYGYIAREKSLRFDRHRETMVAVDPYVLEHYKWDDMKDLVRHLVERMQHQINDHWPHHA